MFPRPVDFIPVSAMTVSSVLAEARLVGPVRRNRRTRHISHVVWTQPLVGGHVFRLRLGFLGCGCCRVQEIAMGNSLRCVTGRCNNISYLTNGSLKTYPIRSGYTRNSTRLARPPARLPVGSVLLQFLLLRDFLITVDQSGNAQNLEYFSISALPRMIWKSLLLPVRGSPSGGSRMGCQSERPARKFRRPTFWRRFSQGFPEGIPRREVLARALRGGSSARFPAREFPSESVHVVLGRVPPPP